MRARLTWIRIVAVAALLLALVAGGFLYRLDTSSGGSTLADWVSRSASSPARKVKIASIDGLLTSNPSVRDISVADEQGVWLKIDRVVAHWSPLALLRLLFDIDSVEVGRIEALRRPVSATTPAQPPAEGARSAGGVPDLPLRVRLGKLSVDEIALAEPVTGLAATLSVTGSAEIGGARDNARADLAVRRLDAPGAISANAAYEPGSAKLALKVEASEPAGGLVARLAKIPGLPRVEIALDGAGALDAFDTRLTAKAGEVASAEGAAQVRRDGASRRVDFDLSARIAELLPKDVAALFTGATKASGAARLSDDGGVALDSFALKSSAFALEASGALDASRKISGRVGLHGLPAAESAAFSAKTLEGDGKVSGTLARPEGALKLLVEDAEGPFGRLGHLALDAHAVPDGDLSDPTARIEASADADASGLALANAGLSEALGETVKLTLRARVSGAGDADVSIARVDAGANEASFTGRAGPNALDGRFRLAVPDLKRFARFAGKNLRGALTLGADLSGAPREGRVAAKLDGAIASPGVGIAAVDGLLGGRLTLSGKLETLEGGGFAFDRLAMHADHLEASLQGKATREKAKIDAKLALPDLHRADPALTGRADIEASLSGSLAKPDVTFVAAGHDASVNGRPVSRLALNGEAHDLTGALTAQATLYGLVDGRPARGRVAAARADGGWKVEPIDVTVGRDSIRGALALDGGGLAGGRLAISAPDLDDLSPLALQKLGGRLFADVTLETAEGGQDVKVEAHGDEIRAKSLTVGRLAAKFSARDLYRRPMLDGEASAEGTQVGKETISKLRLGAKPAGAGAAALDLSLEARGFSVASRATLTPGERIRLDLQQFSAQRGDKKIALAGPALVTVKDGVVDLKGLSVALGSGRFDVDGTVGERLDLRAKARAVPLSVAAIADPSLALDGTLDAEARVTGSKSAPTGDWKIKVAKLTAPQLRGQGLPAIDATASGRLAGGRTSVDADAAIGQASRVKISGSAPVGAGALDLAIKGVVDAGLANTMLAANGQTASGKADLDVRVTGEPANPLIGGSVAIVDAGFNDPLNGVALSKINGRIEGRGREVNITSLTAQTKNGGQIAVNGRITADPEAGLPGSIHIGAHHAQLASTDIVSSVGDLDLTIGGPLMRAPKVTGRIALESMDVNVPDRIPANLKPLPGTVHVRAKGFAAQMLALQRAANAKAARPSKFDMALDLTISAPSRIFVRGRGIDAEFGGELKIAGAIQKPKVDGGFDLRRGTLQLLTQRIDITRGKITFGGGLTPELDFLAETTAADVTAKIGVTGPAAQPVFTFSSSPDLPQDEVLSRLLFAKASGSLTPFQAVQLAAAVAQFSGGGGGGGAFDKVRKSLGVDTLDLDAAGAGGPTIGASRYIMEGVSVSAKTGAKPEQSAIGVSVDIMKGVRAQGETSVDGKTSLGVGVDWEY